MFTKKKFRKLKKERRDPTKKVMNNERNKRLAKRSNKI